ncbi:MAG: helix-turn-helix domain-containing protein [Romboutsia sp.]|uniref:helix-turn-helix domain-containing protein n=1 Tax=Romboutsia sp. TaxID=1965302 RepID=UPI003F3E7AC5
MKVITFGQLLEKLLYLSNQKKSTLARELGYDVSYISKWINAKNLPTQKNISTICKTVAEFIVKALNPMSTQELIDYFEIDTEVKDEDILVRYLERSLKESYIATAGKGSLNIYKSTQSEDNYNSIIHINPRLRKQYLSKDFGIFASKSSKIDIIMSANLYKLNNDDKMSIADMKDGLEKLAKSHDIRVRFLMGFEGSYEDIIFNTLLIINMITMYPSIEFKIYNCDVDSNAVLAVLKDRMLHCAIFAKDRRCLFTSMSKEKHVIDEMYYSLEDILNNQGKLITENQSPRSLIVDKTYIQYIMGQDLRWLMGSMNEFFMPHDLFMEIGESIFKDDAKVLNELNQINVFLQNVTYISKIKILVYEAELRKYISSGELQFFNIPIKLTLEQRERHIKYIEKIVSESQNVEFKLVDGNFVEDFKYSADPSLYLSKTMKIAKTHPEKGINDYIIIKDNEFKNLCDELFEVLWNKREDIVVSDREDILERISKALAYTRIINGTFMND